LGPKKPEHAEATDWRTFNVMARLFGLMALFTALGNLAWAVYFAVHPDAGRRMETIGLPASVLSAAIGLLAATIAAFVLTRRPYRPDLGDAPTSDRTMRILWGLPKNWRVLLRVFAFSRLCFVVRVS
jgi:cation transporter-like permease